MTAGPTSITPAPLVGKRIVPAMEWLAENAYIPPGMHRLLAAGGLAVGLWGGRGLMDILTARRNDDGSDIRREQVPQMFRPLHGMLHYNPYSDRPGDRWKSVIDNFAPAIIGGVTAYYGGKYFFHGNAFTVLDKQQRALHPLSAGARKAMESGKMSLHAAEQLGSLEQATALRKVAATSYVAGATTGTDKAGGLVFGNHNMWADSFAVGAGIKPRIPGMNWFNRVVLGNISSGSVAAPRAMRNIAKAIEGDLHTQGDPAIWLTEKRLMQWAKDGLQNFPHATEADVKSVAEQIKTVANHAWTEMNELRKHGELTIDAQKKIFERIAGSNKHPGLIDQGFDRLLHNAGIDLGSANLSDHGIFTIFARGSGSAAHEAAGRKAYAEYIHKEYGATLKDDIRPKLRKREALVVGGGLAVAGVGLLGAGAVAADRMDKRLSQTDNTKVAGTPPRHQNLVSWINDKPLDVAQWGSRIVITPPSMHRLMSAAYLSAMLFGGMKVANVLTGRHLPMVRSGPLYQSALAKADVKGILTPLRPLHGLLSYTPGSSLMQDRMRQALHYIIPVGFGAVGTWAGSHFYFSDRIKRLHKATSIEDVSDRIAFEQSGAFGGLTAITSVFNTGSGIHLVPFFNYSSNLQSRYVMGDGRQVATPGIGKWWSGNPGLTPWGVKRTLQYMTNYLTYNPDQRPTELASLTHSLLAKLYPDMPEADLLARKQAFINQLYEVRDTFVSHDSIPSAKQDELKSAMKTLLSGDGFEQMLMQAGLNPGEANLSSNGASGAIANALGTKGNVERLQNEYRQKFTERANHYKARSTAEIIAEHAKPAASNDNAANDNLGKSHSERLKAKDTASHAIPILH